jgi:hypothetical protein
MSTLGELYYKLYYKALAKRPLSDNSVLNRTCQGYARKRILKPVGLFFAPLRPVLP